MDIKALTTAKIGTLSPSFYRRGQIISIPNYKQTVIFAPSFLGQSKVYSDQMQALKSQTEAYPNDIEYRRQIMLNSGKNPDEYYKLRSIIGLDEIKSVMSGFNEHEEVYSVGINDENIRNKTIRANLHIHTLASDGFLSTQELLDKAVTYANDVAATHRDLKKEPFIIAITDHDTIESAKEAIEIISKDPLKYKNLRVILGIESTTYNDIITDAVQKPTNTHILVYGIDPNEKSIDNFIKSTKLAKHQISEKIIDQANITYQKTFDKKNNLFSLEQARDFFNPLKKNILGIYNYMETYIQTKVVLEEVILNNPTLIEKLKQKKLPLTSNGLINIIKDYYFQIDKNNTPKKPIETIPTALTQQLDMKPSGIEKVIKEGLEVNIFSIFNCNLQKDLEEYKRTVNPKYDYMPTMETLFEALKNQNGTIIGIAHPLDTVAKIKNPEQQYEFLVKLYTQFKKACREKAGFSEVYYQSYFKRLKKLKEADHIKTLLNMLSTNLNLFKTGSADSHRTNIFKRYF